MASWYVFEPPGSEPLSLAAAEKAVLVRDGMTWIPFVAPVMFVWLLWQRMWLAFAVWLTLMAGIGAAGAALGIPGGVIALVELAIALCFALEANHWRAASLDRRGWRFSAMVTASDRTEAEYRYHAGLAPPSAPRALPRLMPAPPRPREEVLGLFPEPGGRSS